MLKSKLPPKPLLEVLGESWLACLKEQKGQNSRLKLQPKVTDA